MIDGHVHVFREGTEPFPGHAPVEDLLATMESHGVTKAVLVALTADFIAALYRSAESGRPEKVGSRA